MKQSGGAGAGGAGARLPQAAQEAGVWGWRSTCGVSSAQRTRLEKRRCWLQLGKEENHASVTCFHLDFLRVSHYILENFDLVDPYLQKLS